MKLFELKRISETDEPFRPRNFNSIIMSTEYERFKFMCGELMSVDVAEALMGDQQQYNKTQGKDFQSLAVAMLTPDVAHRLYELNVTPAMDLVMHDLKLAIYRNFPHDRKIDPHIKQRFTNDQWNNDFERNR